MGGARVGASRLRYVMPGRRAKLPASGRQSQWARPCEVPGCLEPTQEKKPACPAHVLRMGYAATIATELERREVQLALAPVDPLAVELDGTVVEDVRLQLEDRGALTVAKLAERLDLPTGAVTAVVDRLARAGEVRLVWSKDGRRGARARERAFVELVRVTA